MRRYGLGGRKRRMVDDDEIADAAREEWLKGGMARRQRVWVNLGGYRGLCRK